MSTSATQESPLEPFSEPVRKWFQASFEAPTPAQAAGWPAIASGAHTLICAPTGSGKTLAAFLWGIDRLAREPERLGSGVRIVYVSPLKALSYDIERNLRAPLQGIGAPISVALRTGDTPQSERRAMRREPPDILITTPESLYLMISSQAREILTGVEAVIIDEIHAVAPSKRGSHLALTMERLEQLVRRGSDQPELTEDADRTREIQRIGLSATQRPLERIGDFLVGAGRECEIVDASEPKQLDLEIVVPVEDMVEPSPLDNKRRDGADTGKTPPPNLEHSPERIDPGPIEASLDPATNTRSIWPAIYPELLRLVREHNSTIVFVNNRRAAERIAKRLNEMHNDELEEELPATEHAGNTKNGDKAPPEIARAHHGSLSHEERALVEELLKSGELPCLVATSSLELGIDMGAVDLVIQVESPKSVTRGLQRVGRAGHTLGEVSKGRIFPKFRADLLECAVVARRMRTGEIEETVIPQNPLDVLAQHLVSMAALDEWEVDDVEKLVRSAQPFSELSREQLENVLDMLDGRYPSERFAELRPRIVWDRTKGTMRGRPGARQLAVANAGTIPDRGLYGVHLPDGRRVGELDEEMVYEARPGQTFLLGASTWRIEEITRDRVIVTPAPGTPGAVPFWRGDGIGRPAELGKAIGAFSREAVNADPKKLAKENDLDKLAAQNLVNYLTEQQAATRVVPS
ncbi:MAG TPA: DEAD/DEAH box helicase, partial [Solirubrobacterales bacterium]|nr:DEAD/DEAH box helicase [Solirubrobacterales bacterium]